MMPPQETAHATVDLYQVFMQLAPFFATAGGVFATYAAFGKWLKAWIIKGLIDKDWLEIYLFDNDNGKLVHIKKNYEEKIAELKEWAEQEIKEAKEEAEKAVKDAKDHAANELKNHKERSDEKDEADKKWLRGLQERVEKLQIKVGE